MKLQAIADVIGAECPPGVASLEISELSYDSRRTDDGALFFCLPGVVQDGHEMAAAAVEAGASALVVERPVHLTGGRVPQLQVQSGRAAMNALAAPFFGHPNRQVRLAGVTGTNGKTTITYMLESIFEAGGEKAGLIGTVQTRYGDRTSPALRTTPESVDLQRLLRRMADAGVTRCALEVTSIGIDAGRVQGLEFDAAVFTNLTQDHLDHHGTMERYFESKQRLFGEPRPHAAVVNADDPWGRRLVEALDYTVLRYGLEEEADVVPADLQVGRAGSRFRVVGCGFDFPVEVPIPGRFNVSNALAAAGAAIKMGVPAEAIASGLASLVRVPGRFEKVDEGQDFLVVVDYAHTPDALAHALGAARGLADGRVVTVFGCGGDRDRGKRIPMGRAAGELSDLAYATSDNPRGEDPAAILAEVERGLAETAAPGGYRVVVDRAEAIESALRSAGPGDVVVIAGKGHETGQDHAGVVRPFDDRTVAAEVLRRLA